MMKRFSYAFILVLTCVAMAYAEPRKMIVLTSLDVTQALGEALTRGSSIEVINVIPPGYSMRGAGSIPEKTSQSFFEKAMRADAVLTVGSAWSADPLYKWARRGNIRIVNIDAAQSLDGYGAGVPLVTIEGEPSPYVWRSPANMTRMAAIAADDFVRLSPNDADVIKSNLKLVQTSLFRLRNTYEAAFLDLVSVDLAAMTRDYAYLADEFGLNTHFYLLKQEDRWTQEDAQAFFSRLKKEAILGVLCSWEPGEQACDAMKQGGAKPVVLKRFVRSAGIDPLSALVGWYGDNLSRIAQALQR